MASSLPALPQAPPALAVPRPSAMGARGLPGLVRVQRLKPMEGTATAQLPLVGKAISSAAPSLPAAAGSLPLPPATNADQFPPTRGAESAAPLPLPLRPSPIASLAIQAFLQHEFAAAPFPFSAVQTTVDPSIIEVSPAVPVEVQRAEDEVATPAPSAFASETALVGAASGHPDRELDELSARIYDRIRTRLRTELLIDRERAGLVTDLW